MKQTRNYGFTLIEIIVVLAILAMAAMLIVPRISTSESTLFQSDIREAVSILKYGRRMSVIQGKDTTVVLESNPQQEKRPLRLNPKHWIARVASLKCQSNTEKDEEDTKNDDDNEKQDETCSVTFYPEGGSSASNILLRFQHYRAKITLNPLTGKAEWELLEYERE